MFRFVLHCSQIVNILQAIIKSKIVNPDQVQIALLGNCFQNFRKKLKISFLGGTSLILKFKGGRPPQAPLSSGTGSIWSTIMLKISYPALITVFSSNLEDLKHRSWREFGGHVPWPLYCKLSCLSSTNRFSCFTVEEILKSFDVICSYRR